MWIYVYTFCHKFGKMSQIRISRGSTQIITILQRGGHWNLLQYYKGGGSSRFITILQWGGVSRDPKFVLRNIWTAPYGSAPENSRSLMSHWCGQCWNLSWWKCRQSVSLSICGSFRHIFHLVISIQGLVKMLFRVDIQVDQGVKVLRCWHPVSTP